MPQFFAKEWAGAPFVLFGPAHLTAILLIVALNLAFFLLRGRFSTRARRNIRYILAAVLILDEIGWHLWNYTSGQWTVQTMLPLHLCSFLVFASAYMLVSGNYRIYEACYLLGIAGALQAVLTPDAGIYGFPHFRAFQVMVSHGAIITSAIFMTVVEGYRPTPASLKRVFISANVYMLLVGILNFLIGSNYLFIAHKPETASLLDVMGPWPLYLLGIEGLGIAFMLILYAPFAIKDLRTRQLRSA